MTGHEDFFTLGPETCLRGITMGRGERGEGRGERGEGRGERGEGRGERGEGRGERGEGRGERGEGRGERGEGRGERGEGSIFFLFVCLCINPTTNSLSIECC